MTLIFFASLDCARLDGANLSKAFLQQSFLGEASLVGTKLKSVTLKGANLKEADLTDADLTEANLDHANFQGANLTRANFRRSSAYGANFSTARLCAARMRHSIFVDVHFFDADLTDADLSICKISDAEFLRANLTGSKLTNSELSGADLTCANLSRADLRRTDLTRVLAVETDFHDAILTGARVYGISVWKVNLDNAIQTNLRINRFDEPNIEVDNLDVAQFIYLLLNNEKIRDVIDTITSKIVLILGRFTPPRKATLDAIRERLRSMGYLPVLFDFDKPRSRDLTGTISVLANLARFVIADLTDQASIPHELATVVPNTVVPVQPIIVQGVREYSMLVDLTRRYHWVLAPYRYSSDIDLLYDLQASVIAPAETKALSLPPQVAAPISLSTHRLRATIASKVSIFRHVRLLNTFFYLHRASA